MTEKNHLSTSLLKFWYNPINSINLVVWRKCDAKLRKKKKEDGIRFTGKLSILIPVKTATRTAVFLSHMN